MMSKRDYPPAVILRYRKVDAAGHFKRKITARTPLDLEDDEVTFECGHKQIISSTLLAGYDLLCEVGDHRFNCKECTKQWLDDAMADSH